jgi:S1-C subfamily serine protease
LPSTAAESRPGAKFERESSTSSGPTFRSGRDRSEHGPAFIWAFVGGGLVAVSVLIGAIIQSSNSPATKSEDIRQNDVTLPSLEEVAKSLERDRVGDGINSLNVLSSEEVYRRASPSVLTILVKDEADKIVRFGSGFRIDDELVRSSEAIPMGEFTPDVSITDYVRRLSSVMSTFYLVTNYHVIRDANHATVIPCVGDKSDIYSVVTEDPAADLAVVAVTCFGASSLPPALQLSDSLPAIGSKVFAIGSPEGFMNSIAEGNVSGYRALPGLAPMQISVPLSHGSSGGPVLDPSAKVVGVSTGGWRTGQNLNFAVPSTSISDLLRSPRRPRSLGLLMPTNIDGKGTASVPSTIEGPPKAGRPRTVSVP